MSRKKSRRTTKRQPYLLVAGIVGVILIAVVALIIPRDTTSASESISPAAYQSQFVDASAPHLLLDVRTPEEFASGHIHGAVNISVETLQDHLSEVPRDEPIVVYCRSGNRSAQAAKILAQAGYTPIYDLGGINTWAAQGFPVE